MDMDENNRDDDVEDDDDGDDDGGEDHDEDDDDDDWWKRVSLSWSQPPLPEPYRALTRLRRPTVFWQRRNTLQKYTMPQTKFVYDDKR